MEVGRYDFIAAPTTVTNERAEKMLFTAGYIWTAYQFGIKKGSAPIKGWEDMKGKAVAVNKGTPYSGPSGAPMLEKDLPPGSPPGRTDPLLAPQMSHDSPGVS